MAFLSLFAAVRVPESLPPTSVRRRPGPRRHDDERVFDDRFEVVPPAAPLPETLKRAHLEAEATLWTLRDGHLLTIYRHQLYQKAPPADLLLPAARQAVRTAVLLAEQADDTVE